MGVYIKGMNMPPSCGFCRLAYCCKAPEEGEAVDLRMRNSSRHPNCPLIEVKAPHGRLIDEDDIHTGIRMEKNTEHRYFIDRVNAPTVIEAEESE